MKAPAQNPGKLVCFGEVLTRLSTSNARPLADAQSLELHFAGAEANVAVQFAELGGCASMVTRLPDNRLAEVCLEKLRGRGVDTSAVLTGGSRMGLYFLEPGYGPRASVITYDRAHSAISEMTPGMIDWENVLAGAGAFHWSGITPPLGTQCASVCAEAVAAAKRLGLRVSCDLNYRSALWSMAAAAAVMPALVEGLDFCFCGATEAREILGCGGRALGDDAFAETAEAVAQKYGISEVAMLIRTGESAHGGTLRGLLWTDGAASFSRLHELAVMDRIGSGDSFAGALLNARMGGMGAADAIEFATAAATWKHTISGDWNRGSFEEIQAFVQGASGARVKR